MFEALKLGTESSLAAEIRQWGFRGCQAKATEQVSGRDRSQNKADLTWDCVREAGHYWSQMTHVFLG